MRQNPVPTSSSVILRKISIEKSPWIKLERIFYRDSSSNDDNFSDHCDHFESFMCDEDGSPLNLGNNIKYWDIFSRNTVDPSVTSNSATALAFCYTRRSGDYIFYLSVVEQFRPSVNSKTLEFPSGICDRDESVTRCALRELKEETGYTGELLINSPNLPTSVLGNDNTCLVTVMVNMDSEVNLNPVQSLEPTENITSHIFPLNNLLQNLKQHCNKSGSKIADNLYRNIYSVKI
ncbi:nucleoside diphosphate hydrolase, putative [Theileria annulata]|uniref:Nucleoside diphosphate hydrolase, putative n=1 Tax=Theileria annulata TaxID=5874 RepID=Q4U8T8_THEAN|nr:nucleoside diphosphate hydrolase, putative [Theileria annulata]CAI76765.1 nucleoside diphosphate hydrolase, putative [Theileria annulata]|eukprot:XP_953390.1 nucleoside diphosphate hydrolase, putative [Theileria annulata]